MADQPSGTVTFLFTDVAGSTRRWEEFPSDMKDAVARHDALVRAAIESHSGSVFTTAGDAFCAAFTSPHGALAASLAAQRTLAAQNWGRVAPFLVRMAMHTGNADERNGDYFGPPLNRCARLLSLGHGGQILVSDVTTQLVRDELPDGVDLEDLGPQRLRDLERPERVFQVNHSDLIQEFPELRSEKSVQDAAGTLAVGRQACAAQRWEDAFQALTAASNTIALDAEDLERLGEAAWWTGRSEDGIRVREKAYATYVKEGKSESAAMIALALAESYRYRLAGLVSTAWTRRAEELLTDASTPGYGYLMRWKTVLAFESEADAEGALELAGAVIAAGRHLGDRNLEALGLQDKGRILVAMGEVGEGMGLVDEAMIAALAGELDAATMGRSYCNMLSVCQQVADYERAGEWSDAAEQWCESHSDSVYPGVCRIFRSELKWLRGDWDDAAAEIRRAAEELTGFTPIIGAALYQAGEIELRAGRMEQAAEDFQGAHEHGYTPLPGLAMLRLQTGDPDAAAELLHAALRAVEESPLDRARLLPVWIDVQLALGATGEAEAAVGELDGIAELCGSAAMRSTVAHRRAALALSKGQPDQAIAALDEAITGWMSVRLPYEAALSRLLLAEAQHAAGNEAAARLEVDSARSMLERLGAPGT